MDELGKRALNTIRTIASGDKYRLETENFDLDLTYVTHRVIAMGFPADKLVEQAYRNHIDEVADYFERNHSGHYMVFNLSEKHYNPAKFRNRVKYYGWPDHHPPPMSLLMQIVKAVHEWLEEHRLNVAAIHCKAGLGRTGTVISSYFLYAGFISTPEEALEFFGTSRSQSARGVKVPSQRRCVNYLHQILTNVKLSEVIQRPKKVFLKRIEMSPVPDVDPIKGGFWPVVELVYMTRFHSPFFLRKASRMYSAKKGDSNIVLEMNIPLCGDVLIRVYHYQDLLIGKSYPRLLFRYGFHTSFIEDCRLLIPVTELDGASHGQFSSDNFPSNFTILNAFTEFDHQQPDLEVGIANGVSPQRRLITPSNNLLLSPAGSESPLLKGRLSPDKDEEAEKTYNEEDDEDEKELKAALYMSRMEDQRRRKDEKRISRQGVCLNRDALRRLTPELMQLSNQPGPTPFDTPPLLKRPVPTELAAAGRPYAPHHPYHAPDPSIQTHPRALPPTVPHMALPQLHPQPHYNPFCAPQPMQAAHYQPQNHLHLHHSHQKTATSASRPADHRAPSYNPFHAAPPPSEHSAPSVDEETSTSSTPTFSPRARPQPILLACQPPVRRPSSPARPSLIDEHAPITPTIFEAASPRQQLPDPQRAQPRPAPPADPYSPSPAVPADLIRFPSPSPLISLDFAGGPSPEERRQQAEEEAARERQQRYLEDLTAPARPPPSNPAPASAWDFPPQPQVSVWAQRQMEGSQREWTRNSGGPEPPYHQLQVPCALPSPSALSSAPPLLQPLYFPSAASPPGQIPPMATASAGTSQLVPPAAYLPGGASFGH